MVAKNASGLNSPVNESQGGTNATTFDAARTNMGLNPLISEQTLTYNVVAADRGLLIHYSGGGGVDLTLTAAATLGDGFNFILRNDAAANITINPDGGELINGAATLPVEPGQAVTVFCTGTAFYTEGQAATVDGANVELSNLSGVAINTTLVSDTDVTDNLGTQAIRWNNIYAQNIETGDTAADVLTLSAWDVNGGVSVPFITFTADNTPTCVFSGDITGVTQAPNDNSTKLATTAYADAAASGAAGANTALSNLAGVAINTSLISDTDVTDNLGSQAIRWNNIYSATLQTGDTAADTLQIGAWDVDGAAFVPFITCTANNTPTCALSGDVTGVTQSANDNSTKLATTAYADAVVGGGSGSFVYITSVTASSSATVDFSNYLTSTYNNYLITFENYVPANNATILQCRVGTGGAPTWQTTNYSGTVIAVSMSTSTGTNGSNVLTANTATSTTFIEITLNRAGCFVSNTATGGSAGIIYITNVNDSANDKTVFGSGSFLVVGASSGVASAPMSFGGRWNGATVLTSFRLIQSAGNIATGTFRLYGIKNS